MLFLKVVKSTDIKGTATIKVGAIKLPNNEKRSKQRKQQTIKNEESTHVEVLSIHHLMF